MLELVNVDSTWNVDLHVEPTQSYILVGKNTSVMACGMLDSANKQTAKGASTSMTNTIDNSIFSYRSSQHDKPMQ